MAELDPVTLEILWTRLITVANEQAAALQRTSFTPIVRESGDLSGFRLGQSTRWPDDLGCDSRRAGPRARRLDRGQR